MRRPDGDDGSAIVEFVFVAVVVMVPLIYFLVSVATVQQTRQTVAAAAREAGRAFATGTDAEDAQLRLRAAVRLALRPDSVGDGADATAGSGSAVGVADATVRFVGADEPCDGAAVTPRLDPGAVFVVCVSRQVDIPAVPRLLQGRGITAVGRYVVHIDDFRAAPN